MHLVGSSDMSDEERIYYDARLQYSLALRLYHYQFDQDKVLATLSTEYQTRLKKEFAEVSPWDIDPDEVEFYQSLDERRRVEIESRFNKFM